VDKSYSTYVFNILKFLLNRLKGKRNQGHYHHHPYQAKILRLIDRSNAIRRAIDEQGNKHDPEIQLRAIEENILQTYRPIFQQLDDRVIRGNRHEPHQHITNCHLHKIKRQQVQELIQGD
jgi:hypothetical protein